MDTEAVWELDLTPTCKLETYYAVENGLYRQSDALFGASLVEGIRRVATAISKGDGNSAIDLLWTMQEFDTSTDFQDLDYSPLRFNSMAAYLYGIGISMPLRYSLVKDDSDGLVSAATVAYAVRVRNESMTQVYSRLRDTTLNVINFLDSPSIRKSERPSWLDVLPRLNPEDRYKAIVLKTAAEAREAKERQLRLESQLQTSRLAVTGALKEADKQGIDTYVVDETLDKKTCAFCRVAHGKRYPVRPALIKMEQVLKAASTDELKRLAPWPGTSAAAIGAFKGMTPEVADEKGYARPPYHPFCRGVIKFDPKKGLIARAWGEFKDNLWEKTKKPRDWLVDKGFDWLEKKFGEWLRGKRQEPAEDGENPLVKDPLKSHAHERGTHIKSRPWMVTNAPPGIPQEGYVQPPPDTLIGQLLGMLSPYALRNTPKVRLEQDVLGENLIDYEWIDVGEYDGLAGITTDDAPERSGEDPTSKGVIQELLDIFGKGWAQANLPKDELNGVSLTAKDIDRTV